MAGWTNGREKGNGARELAIPACIGYAVCNSLYVMWCVYTGGVGLVLEQHQDQKDQRYSHGGGETG